MTKDKGEGFRNWKRLFTWAQEEAKLDLFFISSHWLSSPWCIGEFANLIKLKYNKSSYSPDDNFPTRGLFFAVIDNEGVEYRGEEQLNIIRSLQGSVGNDNYVAHFKKFEQQKFTAKDFFP